MSDSQSGTTGPTVPHDDPPWLAELAEHAREDRVVGAAELPAREGVRRLLLVTTSHGFEPVSRDLARIGALVLGAPVATALDFVEGSWQGLTADLRRANLEVVRIGELVPSDEGAAATVLLDRHGLLDQWVRWSRGRPAEGKKAGGASWDDLFAFTLDDEVRALEALEPGCLAGNHGGVMPLRPELVRRLRAARGGLVRDAPLTSAFDARIDALLRVSPQDGAGIRVVPRRTTAADPYDAFLRVADDEGFRGDRVLFDAAAARLGVLSRRPPQFDEGFVLSTFDAVEVRWCFGTGAPLAGTSVVPCVHVGVGVTPADHLEMWAAPAVREDSSTVACVADDGRRTVVPREAGREAMLSTLAGAVESAWTRLPSLLRAARRSSRLREDDPAAALAALHLPRTFRESATALLPREGPVTRLAVALALARAGDEAEPLVARKLAWGAGRLLASEASR